MRKSSVVFERGASETLICSRRNNAVYMQVMNIRDSNENVKKINNKTYEKRMMRVDNEGGKPKVIEKKNRSSTDDKDSFVGNNESLIEERVKKSFSEKGKEKKQETKNAVLSEDLISDGTRKILGDLSTISSNMVVIDSEKNSNRQFIA